MMYNFPSLERAAQILLTLFAITIGLWTRVCVKMYSLQHSEPI